ncbi:MAG: response regulator, partial [Nitrospirota bacterium]
MSLRVLVVDDEPFVAETLRAFLEDEGMQVHVETSGEAAVAAVRSGVAFDACIMDLRLPGMDGDVAAKELHR